MGKMEVLPGDIRAQMDLSKKKPSELTVSPKGDMDT